MKFPAGWQQQKIFIISSSALGGDRIIFWKNGDVKLTTANCTLIFGVCCVQNGAGIYPYPATINSNGEWYSELSAIPGGICTFTAVGFGIF